MQTQKSIIVKTTQVFKVWLLVYFGNVREINQIFKGLVNVANKTNLHLNLGKPMYLMETALGQFSQKSPLAVWKLAPIGRGIGFAMVTISMIVAIYYNVLMGTILGFFYVAIY